MVKDNYLAWRIRPEDFSHHWSDPEKLKFFAQYAILAPSGHNTQPWQFSVSDGALQLSINPARHLPFSGKLAAEPQVSLGACLESLRLAARGFGYELTITYQFKNDRIALIALGARTSAEPSLLQAIVERTSNRNPFDHHNLSLDLLKKITSSDLEDVAVRLVSTRADINFLADQTAQATRTIMTDSRFRFELSKWVRNNITKQYDGMPAFAQGMPTPPSLIARHIIKNIDISGSQAKIDGDRVINSADIVLILIKEPSNQAFVNAGRLYDQICVLAQQHGIASSGVGAAVIDLGTKAAICEHFKLDQQPLALIRLGMPIKSARHTPRWPLSKVFG